MDGFKISTGLVSWQTWLEGLRLSFKQGIDIENAVLLGDTKTTKYKRLFFCSTPSIVEGKGCNLTVRGSLPNFLNDGVKTGQNISLEGMRLAIAKLEKELSLDADNCILQNLEVCVNVPLSFPVSKFLKLVKGHYELRPSYVRENNYEAMEFVSGSKRKEWTLKMYDKGKEIDGKDSNLLRVEIRLHTTRTLKPREIRTLQDFTELGKITSLIDELSKRVEGLIILDNTDFSIMTAQDEARFYRWSNPLFWALDLAKNDEKNSKENDAIRAKKKREKARFESAINYYGIGTIKEKLLFAIRDIWAKRLAEKGPFLILEKDYFQKISSTSKSHNFGIKIKCEIVTFPNFENPNISEPQSTTTKGQKSELENEPTNGVEIESKNNLKNGSKKELENVVFGGCAKARKCAVCGVDISSKKRCSKVCSKTCGNIKNGKERTAKKQAQKSVENNVLFLIFAENLTFAKIDIWVVSGGSLELVLMRGVTIAKLRRWNKKDIRAVRQIEVKSRKVAATLTKQRARKLAVYLGGSCDIKPNARNKP